MQTTLRFVQGAVAKKDFVPALTHFLIRNKTITGYNGELALCAPIEVDFDCCPNATQFLKAVKVAGESYPNDPISLHMTTNGRLNVRAGAFRVLVDCIEANTFPPVAPSGATFPPVAKLLPALRHLAPFIAEDASRPWACGVLLEGSCAYATNNIVLIQYWIGTAAPHRVNIPGKAVVEILRIGKEPSMLQLDDNRLTLYYEDGAWLSTQLFSAQWPQVADRFEQPSQQKEFPKDFFSKIANLSPFTDEIGRCYMLGDKCGTDAKDEKGASVKIEGLPQVGIYNLKQLLNLEPVAKTIDFSMYPKPVLFYGTVSRGLLCGILS
jgi:DNA polymerase III sliding clamp (beta) subunit (PCNA family)